MQRTWWEKHRMEFKTFIPILLYLNIPEKYFQKRASNNLIDNKVRKNATSEVKYQLKHITKLCFGMPESSYSNVLQI